MIIHSEKESSFFLQTKRTSYVIAIHKGAYPLHMYWGDRIAPADILWSLEAPYRRLARYTDPEPDSPFYTHEFFPYEYPDFGTGDFRPAAYRLTDANGDMCSDARYKGYKMIKGKPPIKGLPSASALADDNVETLVIELCDELAGLTVKLFYSVYEDYDVITRHTEFEYNGSGTAYLDKALSVSIDVPQGYDEMIQLSGSALREKHMVRRPIGNGTAGFGSVRGVSSHQQTPFLTLADSDTTEFTGRADGIALVYSSNFEVAVDRDQYGSVRAQTGINSETFRWKLTTGDTFATPEAVLVHSGDGLNGMSHIFHRFLRERCGRGDWMNKERPVLLNTWEACYFDFDDAHVMKLARSAAKAGMELLVLDDGWFGHRNDSTSSLGDWFVNENKLNGGLKALTDGINALGMKAGIWFEPEMISPDSELYRAHPDWCVHIPGRKRSQWRSQLVLDLTREDVREYIKERLTDVLSNANIEYVKWDNNRRITEPGSDMLPAECKGEFYHRYMLGLYEILDTLTARFPHILWENCASGGARFDIGMMCYFSQNWASDNTDGTSRLKIQYGSSLLMPPLWITAHVSASPNHQLERESPLSYREHAAMPFNMGYELNMLQMTDEELASTRAQVERYKELRRIIQFGEFTRLQSPFEGNKCAWQTISEDGNDVLIWYYKPYAEAEESYMRVYPKYLDPDAVYTECSSGASIGGAMLMHMGIKLDWRNGDCFSMMRHYKKQ